jgi:hypothetical protein
MDGPNLYFVLHSKVNHPVGPSQGSHFSIDLDSLLLYSNLRGWIFSF